MTLIMARAARAHRPAPTFLDSLSVAPKVVYSLHKMISTATVAVRVRRSSDNAEADIGFSGSELDRAALLAFTGSASAYVTTFYDQTIGGKHAAQATAANQPRIVNAGAYDRKLVFDGTNDSLKITSLSNGTPYLGCYSRIKQSNGTTTKIIMEASTNFNSAAQSFLFFVNTSGTPAVPFWSLNASNTAGNQRANQYYVSSLDQIGLLSAIWSRSITGSDELQMYVEGHKLGIHASPATTEQTGNFGTFDIYLGARAGTSLFADMELETLVLYAANTATQRAAIEGAIGYGDYYWAARLDAPVTLTKIGSTYFWVDCWHHRVLYSSDVTKPVTAWSVLDDTRLQGPHSIATDGYLYVVDSTDGESVCTYKSDGAGGFTYLQTAVVANVDQERPHRVQYDYATSAFYVINGGDPFTSKIREMTKLTRSGDVLSIADNSQLTFLNQGYSRGFRIYDGKMYIVAEPGKVFEVDFDSTPTYTLLNTYDTPMGFESPNDIFRDSTGKWYLTATNQAICRFDNLSDMDVGTVEDVYDLFALGGTPYYIDEFDGALWIPEIIERNGLTKVIADVPQLSHNYGTENASDLDRHNAFS